MYKLDSPCFSLCCFSAQQQDNGYGFFKIVLSLIFAGKLLSGGLFMDYFKNIPSWTFSDEEWVGGIRIAKLGDSRWMCTKCGYEAGHSKQAVVRHVVGRHTDPKKTQEQCPHCMRTYKNKNSRNAHAAYCKQNPNAKEKKW